MKLNRETALKLYRDATLLELGKLANSIKEEKHPENIITFVVDRNINYTNICSCQCKFCAFYREKGSIDAYTLNNQDIFKKIEETLLYNGTQILIQGGLNPELDINYFVKLFSEIKSKYNINIHGLSAPEICHIASQSKLTIEETLKILKEAGLDSIPGGGAEILVNRVRNEISPNKISWQKWAQVMQAAHKLGIRSTATMMFGTVENDEEIIEHIFRIREIQEKYSGFTAFICWTFQPRNTTLANTIHFKATSVEFLKVLAISRIILDNIDNIQTSWVTQGAKIAQTSLFFGANDFGSTMLEENVVSAAGVKFELGIDDIVFLIKDAGFIPARRDTFYNILQTY